MKNLLILFSCLIFLCLYTNIPAQSDTLTILHVNDTHSLLAPLGPRTPDLKGTRGGIARAAAIIGLSKFDGSKVLTVHGGDAFMGDLFFNRFFGIAEYRLMNAIGFDVVALGNHEFDLGPDVLTTAFDSSIADGGFSVVSTNLVLDDPAVQPLKNYIHPYVIKEMGDFKIGIFSLLTPETNILSLPSPAVVDTNIDAAINASITELMAQGCNLIICLSHLGINYDKQIAASTPYINVIISAHDHLVTETPLDVINPFGEHVYIVQANSGYSHIGKLRLAVNSGMITFVDYQLIQLDNNVPQVAAFDDEVNNLIAEIESEYGQMYTAQCGYAPNFLDEFYDISNTNVNGNTPIGTLVTDAFRWKTGTDLAITVGGATAQPIYAGPIVPADLFRVFGYGFNLVNGLGYRLVTFNILGMHLVISLEMALSAVEFGDEFLPQVSGLEYTADLSAEPGFRLKSVTINGVPIDQGKNYSVTTNEFVLIAYQDLFGIPVQDLVIKDSLTEFQALLDYVVEKLEGTITNVEEDDKFNVIDNYKLEQNYPNPFNPFTTISFSVSEDCRVLLEVFDLMGQKIGEIFNGEVSAGTHEAVFPSSQLSSGTYFYRMKAESRMNGRFFTDVKKMILIK